MFNMIPYLSLQLKGPVQESNPPPPPDDDGKLPTTHPKEKVFGMVRFICCVYGVCCMSLMRSSSYTVASS